MTIALPEGVGIYKILGRLCPAPLLSSAKVEHILTLAAQAMVPERR